MNEAPDPVEDYETDEELAELRSTNIVIFDDDCWHALS
jgi:hypothetical protein